MIEAPARQKRGRSYVKHGDHTRVRLEKTRRWRAIDGRSQAGALAKRWRAYAIQKRGGKQCPPDVRLKIEVATFALWRGFELMAFITADARRRQSLINKRSRRLPAIHAQCDALLERWQQINDSLELAKAGPVNLADMLRGHG